MKNGLNAHLRKSASKHGYHSGQPFDRTLTGSITSFKHRLATTNRDPQPHAQHATGQIPFKPSTISSRRLNRFSKDDVRPSVSSVTEYLKAGNTTYAVLTNGAIVRKSPQRPWRGKDERRIAICFRNDRHLGF